MLERMMGYDERLLPFCVEAPENVWRTIAATISQDFLRKREKEFVKRCEPFYKAITLLQERYNFYLRVLARDPQIMERFEKEMGLDDLNERIVFAMHHCLVYGQKLAKTLKEIIGNFLMEALERPLEELSVDYSEPSTICQKTGICVCAGAKPPYMQSCLVGDLSGLMRDKASQNQVWDQASKALDQLDLFGDRMP